MDDREALMQITSEYYRGKISLQEFLRHEERLRPQVEIRPEAEDPIASNQPDPSALTHSEEPHKP